MKGGLEFRVEHTLRALEPPADVETPLGNRVQFERTEHRHVSGNIEFFVTAKLQIRAAMPFLIKRAELEEADAKLLVALLLPHLDSFHKKVTAAAEAAEQTFKEVLEGDA